MSTAVILTIDTEFVWRRGNRWNGWEDIFARSYDPASVGVPYQLAVLAQAGLKACFFVDPMPAAAFGPEPVRRMIAPILAAGQEVQLHIHPQWLGAQDGVTDSAFELTSLDEPQQRAMIAKARELLIEAGAPAPIAFRAGSFAADDATLRAAASLGIAYDSSHNGSVAISRISLPRAQIAPIRHEGVIEVPVTQIGEPGGRLRPLQLCAVSAPEMAAALDHAARREHAAVTIVSHSFELASREGTRVNRIHQRRFERLCAMLAARREALPTATFHDLDGAVLGREDRPLRPHAPRRAWRQAEQLWSNLYEERPA